MADGEVRFGQWELRRRAEEKRAAEARRAARAGRNLSGLKKEAGRQVKKNSRKLVTALMDKALKGDVSSMRILVMLADKKVEEAPPKRRTRRGLSLAQRWAMEPPWVEPEPAPEEPEDEECESGASSEGVSESAGQRADESASDGGVGSTIARSG